MIATKNCNISLYFSDQHVVWNIFYMYIYNVVHRIYTISTYWSNIWNIWYIIYHMIFLWNHIVPYGLYAHFTAVLWYWVVVISHKNTNIYWKECDNVSYIKHEQYLTLKRYSTSCSNILKLSVTLPKAIWPRKSRKLYGQNLSRLDSGPMH